MEKMIRNFSAQLKDALQIGEAANLTSSDKIFSNILICGMGGSGIGGSIVAELVAYEAGIPILVNKTYSLPS